MYHFKFFNNNTFDLKIILKKNLLKYYNYENLDNNIFGFNSKSKKKYISFYFSVNKKYYHSFNYFNKIYFNNFINILYKTINSDNKLIFIDSDYNYIIPLYNYIFNIKDLKLEKSFFFLTKNLITRLNWVYSYKFFLLKHNISLLFFIDYNNYKFFLSTFAKFNIPIISFLPISLSNIFLDYFYWVSFNNINLNKIFIYNITTSIVFFKYNANNYKSKLIFYNYFKNAKNNIFLF